MAQMNATAGPTDSSRKAHRRWNTGHIMRRLPWWGAAAFLAVGCLLWVYPFVWMVSVSLKSSTSVFADALSLIPSDGFHPENYERAWTTARFGTYLLNTIVITVVSVALIVVRSCLAGYVLGTYAFRGRKLLIGVLVASIFAPTGLTIIPIVQLSQQLGVTNTRLGIILALAGGGHVLGTLLYAGYFETLPGELREAAVLDGAGFLTVFTRIMLPLANPVTATVTVLAFLANWNAFFLPLVFSLNSPSIRTISVGMIAFMGQYSTDWPGMAAAAVISLLPIVALFIAMQRYLVEGVAGAVKS